MPTSKSGSSLEPKASSSGGSKRKTPSSVIQDDAKSVGQVPPPKKQRASGSKKGKEKAKKFVWPDYFEDLYKVFQALNTVLAFCTSRKRFAITFPVVRDSVERLLKRPLDLAQVAQLKALLPDLLKFAYIPREEIQIHSSSLGFREPSPDFSIHNPSRESSSKVETGIDEDEHVLVLEFLDNTKGTKPTGHGLLTFQTTLSPAATKKLIDKRKERFIQAINELIQATPENEDPVALLQAAAREHIPLDPSNKASLAALSTSQHAPKPIPDPEHRPSIEAVIEELRGKDWYMGQILYERTAEAKEARIATLEPPLSDSVAQALRASRNISTFYTHQVTAIQALDEGNNVIVSTSTASGKSIIYQVPLLKFLEEDPQSTAIFIYPTKALAQDQKQALEKLLSSCPGLEHITVATYDGDTPQEERKDIRENASVIFTNFDMIHFAILPYEDMWRRFLKNLKIVAVDELHYYTGTFGSHVAQVIRRFRRICAAVGNRRVRFVSCSATIAKPAKYMRQMFGIEDVKEVTEDGAPSGRKDFLIWSPPFNDQMDASFGKRSALLEATRLARCLMERGIRLIVFCTIRKSCEQFFKALRAELTSEGRMDILERVMSYRGGYTPADRRRIEKEAFNGQLLGIIATNALELGVDIGVLDAVMMYGFPRGGVASFRQQAGRAGRRAKDSLAVFITGDMPIDMHYTHHPEELFDKPLEEQIVDLESAVLIEAHLQCAGQEMPLSPEDEKYFGPLMKGICESRLVKDEEGWYHTNPKFLPHPAKHIALRGSEEDEYVVVDISKAGKPGGTPRILEQIETSRALFELYEGAVYIHQGLTFIIKEVSHDSKMAKLIRSDVNWHTEPRDFTNVDPTQTYRIREIRNSPHRAYYGKIELMTLVFGYFKIRGGKIIDVVDVETPAWERESTGLWMDIPRAILDLMNAHEINPAEAIHAAQHAFLNRFALASDLGTECKPPEQEYKARESRRKRPARLIFYERSGKIGGVATKAFDHVSDILTKAHDAVESCSCETGCAACILSPSCKENNVVKSKNGALIVLKALLGKPIDTDLLVSDGTYISHETVVIASPVRTTNGVQVERD